MMREIERRRNMTDDERLRGVLGRKPQVEVLMDVISYCSQLATEQYVFLWIWQA